MLLLLGVGQTGATWTSAAVIPGTAMKTGLLDVRIDGSDAVTGYDTLDASGLEPGMGVASVFTVTNNGNVPMAYSIDVSGTDPDGGGLADALAVTVTDATAVTPGPGGNTCGGTPISSPRSLAVWASEVVCVAVALPPGTGSQVAGSTTALTVRALATKGGWTDAAPVTGTVLGTVALTAPTLTCGPLGLGSVMVLWDPVAGATGYRVLGPGGALVAQVPSSTLSWTFLGVGGMVSVQAEFGSTTWRSPASDTLTYDAVSLLSAATCT